MLLTRLISVCFAALLAVPAMAQQVTGQHSAASLEKISFDQVKPGESKDAATERFWVGVFDQAGMAQTCIRLDSIVSVSIQSYDLGDDVAITECTIDTVGNHAVRIYGSRLALNRKSANDQISRARQVIDSRRDDRYPSKKFPEGVYSHNVEFQLATADQVKQVYQSILHAWIHNEGCIFRIN